MHVQAGTGSGHVSTLASVRGGAELGQLPLSLCVLGYWVSNPQRLHNAALLLALPKVHTCFHLWPHAHSGGEGGGTHREVSHADTCAQTHIKREGQWNTNYPNLCCCTCSQSAVPAAWLCAGHTDVMYYMTTHTHTRTAAPLTCFILTR